MTKGTPSMGKKARGTVHTICRRCGEHSYHKTRKECSHCGYGKSKKLRSYAMMDKTVNGKRRH